MVTDGHRLSKQILGEFRSTLAHRVYRSDSVIWRARRPWWVRGTLGAFDGRGRQATPHPSKTAGVPPNVDNAEVRAMVVTLYFGQNCCRSEPVALGMKTSPSFARMGAETNPHPEPGSK